MENPKIFLDLLLTQTNLAYSNDTWAHHLNIPQVNDMWGPFPFFFFFSIFFFFLSYSLSLSLISFSLSRASSSFSRRRHGGREGAPGRGRLRTGEEGEREGMGAADLGEVAGAARAPGGRR